MKLKRILVVMAILGVSFLVLSFTSPRDSEAAEETDIDIVGIEWGSIFGYNITQSDFGPGQYFGLNLAVANNIVVGFTVISGDGVNVLDYNLLKFSYFIGGKKRPIGLDILIGGGGPGPDTAAGVGFFLNLFQKQAEEISTALKLKVAYLFTANVNPEGSLLLTLSGQIGL